MTDDYEFFVEIDQRDESGRPQSLWRRSDMEWEYLSLIDWRWHKTSDRVPHPPELTYLSPIPENVADELSKNRQYWVAYWAAYESPTPDDKDAPYTVLRRRTSPELVLDEAFGRSNTWIRTSTIVEYESQRTSNPPNLVRIDASTADKILRDTRGATNATQL
ncbi:hypothetical protein GCM10010151_52990 [Actinoallomurus spadix]|uniref:Uncharacterized protein n=1 Tax=Actinoallomurus spadix TaxID=79912 RepID=A0ABN0X744_9ACTN